MLKLQEVTVKYNEKIILNDLNYQFELGKIYLLNGENGSGKSTLLKAISGAIRYSGNIANNGIIGYMPDKTSFPLLLSSYEYLKIIARLNNTNKILQPLIKSFNLEDKLINSLSKGNYQKISVIQLFLSNPDIYLLDEPFDGLDAECKSVLKKLLIEKKNEDKLIILSIHDKKIFTSADATILEIKGGELNEKKDKKRRAVQNIL